MPAGPLSGLLIIDLTRILAGPFCTMTLGELGARVIKVEPPGKGDDSRHFGPFIEDKSAYFMSINRGKESIALDLKASDDRRIFEGLLSHADVIVENFRPGTMEKLGYGWDELHRRYPKLIYAASSGFGHSGPLSQYPAYDMVIQGMGGMMSVTGQPDAPPTSVGMSICDISAGMFTVMGIQAALIHRLKTGEATKVDIAMLDCVLALLEGAVMRYSATGKPPGRLGSRHPSITPFAAFQTADKPLIIAAGNDSLFVKLAQAIGREDLAEDRRFTTNDLRNENEPALKAELERTLMTDQRDIWLARMNDAGVPCAPINDIAEITAHPQVAARSMLIEVEDRGHTIKLSGNPIKLEAFPDTPTRSAAPDIDQDRERILAEFGLR